MLKKIILTAILSAAMVCCKGDYTSDISNQYYNAPNVKNSEILMDATDFSSFGSVYAPEEEPEPENTDFPSSFDLRDLGLMTSVKNQEGYGTCWAICATESMETQIIKNKYETSPDLSEWHLAYFAYSGDECFYSGESNIFYSGGTNTVATATLSRWIGAVNEQYAVHGSSETLSPDLKYLSNYNVTDVYNVHSWVSGHKKHSTEFLKELIYNQNAVSVFYCSYTNYYNSDTFAQYCPDSTENVTHAIILAGWDDNYPKENFRSDISQPENDGAWLVKNSWGDEWGDNGYFWLSYEDATMCEASCYFCEPAGTYSLNYGYDDYGWITSVSPDSRQKSLTGYMSNIFTAENDDPVSAVSFYTTDDNAEYEITIYTDITSSRTAAPIKGTPSEVTKGSQKYSGYHTVTLTEPVPVKKGSKFSVVIKITNPDNPYMIATEASKAITMDNIFSQRTYAFYITDKDESSKSYISSDGKSWSDISGKLYTYLYPSYLYPSVSLQNIKYAYLGNTCIRAFTQPAESPENIYDINHDGEVNNIDLIIMISLFNNKETSEYSTDFNSDGKTDIIDFILIKNAVIS